MRYLPAEVVGTGAALLASWWASPAGTAAVVVAAVVAEIVGFYGVVGVTVAREQWRHTVGQPHRRLRTLRRTLALLAAEFGPSELLDSLLVRPALLVLTLHLMDNVVVATLVGKIAADVVFYVVAAMAYHLTVRSGVRTPLVLDTRPTATADQQITAERVLRMPAVQEQLRRHGTPLLVLEPMIIADRYRAMQQALPSVRFHYAVKALAHEAAIRAVDGEGGWFDVASTGELNLVQRCGIHPSRVIHTHPVKTRRSIDEALAAGVRTFVVDTVAEAAKFRPHDGAHLLIRLSFPNPTALSDLSTKFGAPPARAAELVRHCVASGLDVAGLSFHVGSQLNDIRPWEHAVRTCLSIIDELARSGIVLRVLDLGGGLPAPYDGTVIGANDLARVIDPLMAGRPLQILAEPGRAVVAEAMTLISSVVGVDQRDGVRWCHLDDGVYGSFSNVIFEKLTPPLVLLPRNLGAPVRTTLAGPTCDSVDVVLRDRVTAPLEVGDLVVSPVIGAYSTVSATAFNGLGPTEVLVVDSPQQRQSRLPQLSHPDRRPPVAHPVTPAQPIRIPDLTPTLTIGTDPRRRPRPGSDHAPPPQRTTDECLAVPSAAPARQVAFRKDPAASW